MSVSVARRLRLLERANSLQHFYSFARDVFGLKELVPHAHQHACDELQAIELHPKEGQKIILILMPRGSFKTSIVQAYVAWRVLRDRNTRALFVSSELDLAKQNLGVIRSVMENKESKFQDYFGDLVARDDKGRPKKWNEDEIELTGKDPLRKEPNVKLASLEVPRTGGHYDLVVLDDLVNHDNVSTPERCARTLAMYRQTLSVLEPNGVMVVVGTRYLYDDLYGFMLGNNETGEVHADRVIVRSAYNEDGSLFFPERLTKRFLDDQRKKQGPYIFSCQYENNPVNAETAVFLQEDFRYIGKHAEVPKVATRFLLVDPSRGATETSDFSALVSVAVDETGRFFVEMAEQRRLLPSQLADWIFDLHKALKFDRIGVELVGMQMIYDLLQDRISRGAGFIPVVPVRTATNVSKHMRIRRIEPYFKAHRIYLMPGLVDLEKQLTRFPKINKDDLVDALSMFPDVVYAPGQEPKEQVEIKDPNRVDFKKLLGNRERKPTDDPLTWRYPTIGGEING